MPRSARIAVGIVMLVAPYLLAVALKTGIFEHPVPTGMSLSDFIYEVYFRPMWLETCLVTIALMVGYAIAEPQWSQLSSKFFWWLIGLLGMLLVSLAIVLAGPKLGVSGTLYIVWLPLILCSIVAVGVVYALTPNQATQDAGGAGQPRKAAENGRANP